MTSYQDQKDRDILKKYFATFGDDEVQQITASLTRQCQKIKDVKGMPPLLLDPPPKIKLSIRNNYSRSSIEYRVLSWLNGLVGPKFEVVCILTMANGLSIQVLNIRLMRTKYNIVPCIHQLNKEERHNNFIHLDPRCINMLPCSGKDFLRALAMANNEKDNT